MTQQQTRPQDVPVGGVVSAATMEQWSPLADPVGDPVMEFRAITSVPVRELPAQGPVMRSLCFQAERWREPNGRIVWLWKRVS